ncbi:glycosyltransferase family 2 protein [Bosea sp. BH3]|uniref:glycosyltransferase family 2 protein n=1 Tax=Bosea sp. BH3 TaxID=2871701 RepID=UPI0021CB1334|nr:glycosyltransferase family 2 protein [Bosea sp. BH3]MCU4181252.1 glycosyltransferase family 2 protein [Bosea sp. BH3]
MTPAVSVCIPTYEQPDLAMRAIHSVQRQVGCDFEIVVTDDSRSDAVQAAMMPLLSDERVRYYRNERQMGAVANWNEAIRRGRGQVRKILHHDDWLAGDDALARFAEPILGGRSKLVFGACNARSADGGLRFVHSAGAEQIARLKQDPNEILFANFIGAPSVVAIDASLTSRFDPTYLWLSDLEFYRRAIVELGGDFEYLHEPLINISTDLPSQISRVFEQNHDRAYYEYALAHAAATLSAEHQEKSRAFLRGFAEKIPARDQVAMLLRAIGTGRLKLALAFADVLVANFRKGGEAA